jgi:hypothetical protein
VNENASSRLLFLFLPQRMEFTGDAQGGATEVQAGRAGELIGSPSIAGN